MVPDGIRRRRFARVGTVLVPQFAGFAPAFRGPGPRNAGAGAPHGAPAPGDPVGAQNSDAYRADAAGFWTGPKSDPA